MTVMKVIDLFQYKQQRDLKLLEDRAARLITSTAVGATIELKQCFKDWLKLKNAV